MLNWRYHANPCVPLLSSNNFLLLVYVALFILYSFSIQLQYSISIPTYTCSPTADVKAHSDVRSQAECVVLSPSSLRESDREREKAPLSPSQAVSPPTYSPLFQQVCTKMHICMYMYTSKQAVTNCSGHLFPTVFFSLAACIKALIAGSAPEDKTNEKPYENRTESYRIIATENKQKLQMHPCNCRRSISNTLMSSSLFIN